MRIRDEIELNLLIPRICEDCGEEFECGIDNAVHHSERCKHNAPNENIRSHYEDIKWQKIEAEREKINNKLWKKMNKEEKSEMITLTYGGGFMMDANTICMGSKAWARYDKFINKMKEKYL
jgi:hypothetical protein